MKILSSINHIQIKIYCIAATMLYFFSSSAFATNDPFKKPANVPTVKQVATNVEETGKTIGQTIITLVTIGGFVIVAISLYSLWKASKDQGRESYGGAIIGLIVGGAMSVVGTLMWAFGTTLIGSGTP